MGIIHKSIREANVFTGICDQCGVNINHVDRIAIAPDKTQSLAQIDMVKVNEQYFCVPCYKVSLI